MKKMKKISCFLFAGLLMLSLAGCTESAPSETESMTQTETEAPAETVSAPETETETEPESTEETPAQGQTYVSEELKNCLKWPGHSLSELGIHDYYVSADGNSISLSGKFCGAPVNYGTAYLHKDDDGETRIDNLYMLPEGNMYAAVGDLIETFGAPTGEGEEPYSSANGGAVSWISFRSEDIYVQLSQGEENDFYRVTAEISGSSPDERETRMQPYVYSGDDPVEQAISAYILSLKEETEGSGVLIPAFCYFRAARSEDGELMVYGDFWTFYYTGAGRTFYCARGSACPGVLYISVNEDGLYEVTKFDRVGDGTEYREDVQRIADGDEDLEAQFYSAQDASKDPLLTARVRYLAYYVQQNELEMDIYQDLGKEAIQFRTEGDGAELPEGPWFDLYEEEEKALEPEEIGLDMSWEFADFSAIHSGKAILYHAKKNRNGIIVGVNAGHGTEGGASVKTWCHPDGSAKVTGGTTAAGSVTAMAVSTGMTFLDGTLERDVNLQEARILRDLLLDAGYDVLMIRDSDDVQLDNIARTVICNNVADCHIAIHWDGDGLSYDKGCFCMTVPDALKSMYPVSEIWPEDNRLGESLIEGLESVGAPIHGNGLSPSDLTQTSFSKIPSIDVELGNAASDHSNDALWLRARGLLAGINIFFGK